MSVKCNTLILLGFYCKKNLQTWLYPLHLPQISRDILNVQSLTKKNCLEVIFLRMIILLSCITLLTHRCLIVPARVLLDTVFQSLHLKTLRLQG